MFRTYREHLLSLEEDFTIVHVPEIGKPRSSHTEWSQTALDSTSSAPHPPIATVARLMCTSMNQVSRSNIELQTPPMHQRLCITRLKESHYITHHTL